MNVLLTLVKPGAMSVLLCEAWPHLVDALLLACGQIGQHGWMVVGCLRTLLQTDSSQVWSCLLGQNPGVASNCSSSLNDAAVV